jgi:hypothetical protein
MGSQDTLGRAAVAVAATCAIIIAGSVAILMVPSLRARLGFRPEGPSVYVAGELIDVPSSAYSAAPHTILIFARGNCPACQKAKPFLAALVADAGKNQSVEVRLFMSGTEELEIGLYAAEIGVPASAAHVTPAQSRLRSVPTIVLVDRTGLIAFAREGIPETTSGQEEILRAMRSIG